MSLCVTYKESMEFRGLMFQNTTKIGWILLCDFKKVLSINVVVQWYSQFIESNKPNVLTIHVFWPSYGFIVC